MKRKEPKFEEDKERELRNMENTLRQEWNNERQVNISWIKMSFSRGSRFELY